MEPCVYFLYLSNLLYGVCVNIFIMNGYISKTATKRSRILSKDNIQSGGSCSVNYYKYSTCSVKCHPVIKGVGM